MSIDQIRSSLSGNDLKKFNDTITKCHMADNVKHVIIDMESPCDFIIKACFDQKPYNGLIIFRDGEIACTNCY